MLSSIEAMIMTRSRIFEGKSIVMGSARSPKGGQQQQQLTESALRSIMMERSSSSIDRAATFKAGMLDLERRMNAAGDNSCVTCFGGKQSLSSAIRKSPPLQMEGKKIFRILSMFACVSLKTLSSPSSSARRSAAELKDVIESTAASEEQRCEPDKPRILLRIVMWGGPNTLLLMAPVDAPAECVIKMVLDSYVTGVQECQDFELYCAHCNSPALHPKQPIGTVGSRHLVLCRKGPQIPSLNLFNSHSQIAQASHFYSSQPHFNSSQTHFNSSYSRHSRSHSHGGPAASQSFPASHPHHRRSNSWWNPVQCLTLDQH